MTNQHEDETSSERDTTRPPARRELLGAGASRAASVLFGALAVACGDDDRTTRPSRRDGSIVPAVDGSTEASNGGPDSGLTDASTPDLDAAPPIDVAPPVDVARTPDRDIEPLNALLINAYHAATAYGVCGVMIQSAPTTDVFAGQAAVLRDISVSFQAHHTAHAQQLRAGVLERGGTPVTEQEVSSQFKAPDTLQGNPSITNVLKYAAGLERTAAILCNHKIGQLEAAYYRYLASTIEGVQAQHFSVLLGLLTGTLEAGGQLTSANAAKVVPVAFIRSVEQEQGLDTVPPRYFN